MRKLLLDVLERTVATYLVSFLGLIIANGTGALSLDVVKAAALAALPGALAVIKGFLGGFIGDSTTAAWLPRNKNGTAE